MTKHTTKELYAMFLESDFWIELSRLKRRQAGKCQRCPARKQLQAHHIRYPEHWFDTRLEDLEVLCRDCHEKEHRIAKVVFTPNTPQQARERRQGLERNGQWKPWQNFRTTPIYHYVNRGASTN